MRMDDVNNGNDNNNISQCARYGVLKKRWYEMKRSTFFVWTRTCGAATARPDLAASSDEGRARERHPDGVRQLIKERRTFVWRPSCSSFPGRGLFGTRVVGWVGGMDVSVFPLPRQKDCG
jgi:hypothetical protein